MFKPDCLYIEKNIEEYELGKELLVKYQNIPKIEIENHNNIEEMRKKSNSEFAKMKRNLIIGTRKTHKYVGACCGIIATEQIIQAPITPEKIILGGMLISGSMIGALLLDIEHTGSTMGKKHPFISKITNFLFGHRGVTHAPLIWISLTLLLFYLNIIMPNLIRLLLVGCFCFCLLA